jgi:hypothetical protein
MGGLDGWDDAQRSPLGGPTYGFSCHVSSLRVVSAPIQFGLTRGIFYRGGPMGACATKRTSFACVNALSRD